MTRQLNLPPPARSMPDRIARLLTWPRLRRIVLHRSAGVRYLLRGQASANPQTPEALFSFADRNLGIAQVPEEVQRFHAFLRERSPRVVCEIGTYSGGHFYMLSRALPTVKTLIGIDLHVRNKSFIRRLAPPGLDIHLIDGDSGSDGVRDAVKHAAGGQPIDVLFIDGDHRYDGVRRDFLTYRDLVRDGGVIAFHDIVDDHQGRFGRKTIAWTGDVPEFWRRLKPHAQTFEFVADPEQDGYGIGAVIHSAGTAIPPELGD
ncbi:MAG TPA: class I SAM-dependent methyltransferase [Candidatus Micrarchaeaceae archaeon]|nr:class I SAM-dependent methyltransferase [Candidatus Micrarchaeaceae archaeon]